ncbi:MAG: hypothetical protein R3A78_08405 [Polyangiales bacterium]|nr:hypothetical protein [Myxococcales bacterium]
MIRNRYSWIAALLTVGMAGTAFAQDEAGTEGSAEGSAEFSADMSADTSGDASGDMDADMGGDVGGGQAVAYAARGITLPEGTLRVDFAPADRAMLNRGVFMAGSGALAAAAAVINNVLGGGLGGLLGAAIDLPTANPASPGFSIGDGDMVALSIGGAYGITDDFEVGGILLPLALNPSSGFGDMSVYGRYRLSGGNTEVGLQAAIQIPTNTDFGIGVGLPVRFHLSESMMLNTGVEAGIIFATGDAGIGLNLPLEFAVNVMPNVFLGAFTGVNTALNPNALKLISLPLGVFGGYSLDLGNKMLLDLSGQFAFQNFLQFGDYAGDTVVTDGWAITLGATFHYGLM